MSSDSLKQPAIHELQLTEAETATTLRQHGNELYKQGEFRGATETYLKAAGLSLSTDPLPSSNLSAVYFEIGLYTKCLEAARTALEKCSDHDDALKKRLRARCAQAILQLSYRGSNLIEIDYEEVFTDPTFIAARSRLSTRQKFSDSAKAWRSIIRSISSFKPCL